MGEIDALKKQIEIIEAERDMLRLIVDTLPDIIYVKDQNSRHLFGNRAKLRLYHAASQNVILGKTDLELHPEHGAEYLASEQEMLRSGKSIINREEQIEREDGETGYILTSKILFFDEEGNVKGFVGIGRDITEFKKMQEIQRSQQNIIREQQATLKKLSNPVIPLLPRLIILPMFGEMTTNRSQEILRALLAGISRYRAKVAILDLTGVPTMDDVAAANIIKCLQAARLKGTKTILTGITDEVTETLVNIGIDWGLSNIAADLQGGVMIACQYLGIRLILPDATR